VNDVELKKGKVKRGREGEKQSENEKRTKIIPTSFCLDRSRFFHKCLTEHERDRQWSFSESVLN
jgi:hypothetical protein